MIPYHIAIIMDGNRRWARARKIPDLAGHEEGHEALERTIKAARDIGVKIVTVYALSTENVKERSKREVLGLFNLLRKTYSTKLKQMMKEGVRVSVLGELRGLPSFVRKIITEINRKEIEDTNFRLNIAFNYGGKREILQAIEKILKSKVTPKKVSEEMLRKNLYTGGQPDPELVIRTGGRNRLSNFLLWQTAYSEFYFTKVLWPDFDAKELKKAIVWYQTQKRNFGR
ncbi:di-trans,poly-cis-decaprenylcistransferase [Candidatus Daviesbacteria bacterium RIFCSPHIGHO2_01_FULL_40_11]|uniref:Isoprenyl transferase n=1 Tax=Candidatus Daviesbacteria bacterium RIFCSPHIGHO2_01_FULL_40_11 TaxID=1797762 RepID=A0A1F5JGQ2_9BACT|nr:MAG: di-trans,poly-cis-decaprenylcistransferase [Candidatus Daviesbacteria bacterium RIFCSPHIGHO2_01_FULL_40_11]